MKKLKMIPVLLVVFAMIFSLVACGDSKKTSQASQTPEDKQTVTTQTPEDEEVQSTEQSEEVEEPAPTEEVIETNPTQTDDDISNHPRITIGDPEEIGHATWACENVYMMAYDLTEYFQNSYSIDEQGEYVQNYEIDPEKFNQNYEILCTNIKKFMDAEVATGEITEYLIEDNQLFFINKENIRFMMDIVEVEGYFGSAGQNTYIGAPEPSYFTDIQQQLLENIKLKSTNPVVAVMCFDHDGEIDKYNNLIKKLEEYGYTVHEYLPDKFARISDTQKVFDKEAIADVWFIIGHGDVNLGERRPIVQISTELLTQNELEAEFSKNLVEHSMWAYGITETNQSAFYACADAVRLDAMLPTFSDTLIFASNCSSCWNENPEFSIPNVYLDHNAKAYLGYDFPVIVEHAFDMFEKFVESMNSTNGLYSTYEALDELNDPVYIKEEANRVVFDSLFDMDKGAKICLFARTDHGYLYPALISDNVLNVIFTLECEDIDNPENVMTFTINYPDDYFTSNGEYVNYLHEIPIGKYKVTATASGYETSYPYYEVTISENERVELNIEYVKSGEEAYNGPNIYIADSVTGSALEDVTIKYARFYSNHNDMSDCQVTTYGEEYKGYYSVVLKDGFYTLALEKEGYETLYIDEYKQEYSPMKEIGYQMKPIEGSDETTTEDSFEEGIPITEEYFPDYYFRELVASPKIDSNRDGLLSKAESANIVSIHLEETYLIKDMKGIEYFTELTELYCPYDLYRLDVSKNTKLVILQCINNPHFESGLDVSNNTNLEKLYCSVSNLTSLDVSNNPKLAILDCGGNHITNLDLSNNTELCELNCAGNELTSLDLSNKLTLMDLYCHNNQLTSLDFSNNPWLTTLYCYNNPIKTLDFTYNSVDQCVCDSGIEIIAEENVAYLSYK